MKIANFADIRPNNNAFTQSNREFLKYELRKKCIFQQLGTKIANLLILGRITAYLHKGKKKCILKPQKREKFRILQFFEEMVAH